MNNTPNNQKTYDQFLTTDTNNISPLQLVVKIYELFENYRKECLDPNLLKDVRVEAEWHWNGVVSKEVIHITYDGSGYDQLSLEREFCDETGTWHDPAATSGRMLRFDLQDLAKKHGYLAEDKNSWSMSIDRY